MVLFVKNVLNLLQRKINFEYIVKEIIIFESIKIKKQNSEKDIIINQSKESIISL